MSSRAVLVALLSLLCGITCLHGQKCDPDTCSCKKADGTVEVKLREVDDALRKSFQNIIDNSTEYIVYASLCQPLACGDTNNSLVCATLKPDNTNVSYGDLSSLRYLNATEEADEYCVVLEMTGGVDTHQPHAIRSSRINLNCRQPLQTDLEVVFNSTRDISEISLNITLNTHLNCVQEINPNAMSTISSTPSAESFSSSILVPFITPTLTSAQATTSSSSSSSPNSPPPSSFTLSSHSLTRSTTTTHPPTSTTHTTTTSTPTTPSSHTSPPSPSTTTSSTTPTSTTHTFTTPTSITHTSTTPSFTTPSSTTPSSSLSSTPSLPSCLPQSCAPCDSCSEKLALSLGLSIPGTALLTILLMILICACFQKTKKKGVYIRMAPTVYFDEDDRD